MRRLFILALATTITLWAHHILQQSDPGRTVALRDGLILLAAGALLFALYTRRPEPRADDGGLHHWPLAGRLFSVAGIACSLAAGLLLYWSGARALMLPVRGPGADATGLWLAGGALLLAGIFWPDRISRYPRPVARWDVDEAGHFVRRALAHRRRRLGDVLPVQPRSIYVGLAAVTILGALLRLWSLATLPTGCSDAECAAGFQALDWLRHPTFTAALTAEAPEFTVLSALFLRVLGPSLLSLRLAAAAVGIATIPALYLAARQATRPGSALLAAVLLAFSPWHIQFSRSPTPALLLALLLTLYAGAALGAMRADSRRRWAAAGLLLGAGLLASGPLWPLVLAGAVVAVGLRPGRHTFAYAATALAVAVPLLVASLTVAHTTLPGLDALRAGVVDALARLYRDGDLLGTGRPPLAPLLDAVSGVLAVLGVAYMLRHPRWPPALFILGGLLVWGTGLGGAWALTQPVRGRPVLPAAAHLLPLLPLLLLAATVALDRLLLAFAQAWRPLLSPGRTLAWTAVALALALGSADVGHLRRLAGDPALYAARNPAEIALGTYLAGQFQAADRPARIFVPGPLLQDPAVRLSAGVDLTQAEGVEALNAAHDVPFTGMPTGDLLYIVPARDTSLLALFNQVYLGAPGREIRDGRFGQLLFVVYRVPQSMAQGVQGLSALYFSGNRTGTLADARMARQDGPLRFDWRREPPLEPPFSVEWRGTLWAPTYGDYSFQVEAGDAVFGMQLDSVVTLDTSMNLREHTRTLAQGLYQVEMRYYSGGQAGDLAVRWRPPGGEWEILPRNVLYSLALPRAGLLGDYFAGDTWDGELLNRRRDLVLQPDPDLARPYSVLWTGKLAAPVAGEYRLTVSTNGYARLQVDGQAVVEVQAVAGPLPGSVNFATGAVHLSQGWHDLELRYRPGLEPVASAPGGAAPQIDLLWQPPGGVTDQVDNRFLLPLPPDAATENLPLPLPTAPPVTGPAPERPVPTLPQPTPQEPQVATPPTDLPRLPFERRWQVGDVCGSGPEQFNGPRGVAVDVLEGWVYVVDAGNRRVVSRSLDDGTLADFYTDDRFQEPFDVDVTVVGELFVLDAAARQIFRITPMDGVPQSLVPETTFYQPRGLAVDLVGNLYVADTGGARVVVLYPDGRVVTQSGGPDTPLGQGQPVDVLALPNGAVWAVTAQDGGLWRLDTGTGQIAAAPTDTSDGPHLDGLSNSTFFVTDPARQMVLHYDAGGAPVGWFGGPEFFDRPVGIGAALYNERIYVAVSDSAACRVSLWTAPLAAVR